jgi:hypothetical protein
VDDADELLAVLWGTAITEAAEAKVKMVKRFFIVLIGDVVGVVVA